MDEEVRLSVQDTLTPDELLLQIHRSEDEESWSAFAQRHQESCKPAQESDAENVAVHTVTSPGESVKPQQQQVQTEDLKHSTEECAEDTGSRPIITAKSRSTKTDIKELIANCPTVRNIQNPKYYFIFKNLKTFKWLFYFGLITKDELRKYVDELGKDDDGGSTEKVKRLLQFILFQGNEENLQNFDQLEQDLIKSLDDEDPVERIKKALLHAVFWSESRRLEFICKVANQEEVKRQKHSKNQTMKIRSYSNMKSFQNWKTVINEKKPGLIEQMERARAKHWNQENATYPEHLYGLLRFIRNCMEHRADVAVEMNFTIIFPDLFETVYKLAKMKDWISVPQ